MIDSTVCTISFYSQFNITVCTSTFSALNISKCFPGGLSVFTDVRLKHSSIFGTKIFYSVNFIENK